MLHYYAHLHTANHTIESLSQLLFEVLNPNLAHPDCRLFALLRDALRGRHFASDLEVKEAVHVWLATQPKIFFSEGIQKLVDHWTMCVEKDGDCIEK
jgi:hypothetical protein